MHLSAMSTSAHVDSASTVTDSEATTVIGGGSAPGSSPIGGLTPSSSKSKNIELFSNTGMGDLKATKPYKREPLHRFVIHF